MRVRRTGRRPALAAGLCLLSGWLGAATFNVTTYGAVGDGATDNTTAIQDAINAASTAGGGVVLIPAASGTYLSNALTLASGIDLSVAAGAELQMEPYGAYDGGSANPPAFITADKLSNVTVNGGGVIDGQGLAWWNAFIASSSVVRPNPMLIFSDCTNVTVEDVTLQNAPNVNQQYWSDTGVLISGETVYEPYDDASDNISPNTDGMDIASTNMVIQNCDISDGDDDIAIGSSDHYANDITITGCTFGTGHGLSIGSHTTGGVDGVWVSDCTFTGTQYGLRFKSDRGSGGLVTDVNYSGLTMTGIVYYPIYLFSYYDVSPAPTGPTDDPGGPATLGAGTPQWQDITFTDISATTAAGGADAPMQLWALPESKATDFLFDDVRLYGKGDADVYHAAGVTFTCTCRINGAAPSASNVTTSDAAVDYLACASPTPTGTPASSSPTSTDSPTTTGTATQTATLTGSSTRTSSPTSTRTVTPTSSPTSTRTMTPSPTPTASPTSTRTMTPSLTVTASPTSTRTVTPSLSGTATNTAVQTATSTGAATSTATPSGTPTLTASSTPTRTSSPTTTATPASSPSFSATATSSPTADSSPSATGTSSSTSTRTSTLTPTADFTATLTASPASTPTSTSTFSATVTSSLTQDFSPSATVTSSLTQDFSPSATVTSSLTPDFSPSATATPGLGADPSRTATMAPSPTSSPTPAGTATSTQGGALAILGAAAVPNPDPLQVALNLEGPVGAIEGTLYTVSLVRVGAFTWGPQAAGWVHGPLPPDLSRLPAGLYYLRLTASRGSAVSSPVLVKLMFLR